MFEKENSSDIETQSVIKISVFLWKKYGETMHQKVVSDQLLILVNSPKLKQRGPETSNYSLFGLQNMFRKIPSLVNYLSPGQFWCFCTKLVSELFQKLHLLVYTSQLMMTWSFQFHLTHWIWQLGKKGKKLRKVEYLGNEKIFLFTWIKNNF